MKIFEIVKVAAVMAAVAFASICIITFAPDPSRASGAVREDVSAVLKALGYQISYEVAIKGGGERRAIEFYSASNTRECNVIHVAVVNGLGKNVRAGIYCGEELKRLSDIGRSNAAPLLINGGYFAMMNGGIYSLGYICTDFTKKYPRVIKHEAYPYICIDEAGVPAIMKSVDFKEKSRKKNRYKYYMQTKPLLVKSGKVPASLQASDRANDSKNPRTVLGIAGNGSAVCVVVEGRREDAMGMSQIEIAGLLIKLGAVDAINLDGGGSSTIILNGVLMNKPAGGLTPFTLPGQERPIQSAVFFNAE